MVQKPATAIIIPCYDEADRLALNIFLSFAGKHRHVSFIFVNDGSTDNTPEVLKELCQKNPQQIILIETKENNGKAAAVRKGFLKAFDGQYKYIGYWDADLATPLDVINDFLDILESKQLSIILGSRVKLLGYNIKRRLLRHYLGRFFATIVSLILGIQIYDSQCGAKIFKNDNTLQAIFREPFTTNWIFDVEILARFILLQKYSTSLNIEEKIVEFPLKSWQDIAGSKIRIVDFFKAALDIIRIFSMFHGFPKKKSFGDKKSLL